VRTAAAGEAPLDDSGLVVLKRIWPELAQDPDFIAMFLDEARVCVRMNHPNVVRTHEVGREGDQLYIAMEYLRGRSLRQLAARVAGQGGLPLPLHLQVLADVLAGLEHAHTLTDERGAPLAIVHRDVSPQNVFLTYDGAVKLVDFGIAKSVAASHRTRPGVMKGRVAYMAPEQMRGAGQVDRRADLFSVGVMLWEAAAGRRLWDDLPEAAIVGRLLSGPAIAPPLGPHRLPTGLLRVCRRALALDPRDRYATAAEFRADLLPLLRESSAQLQGELGRTLSTVFAEERTAMTELVRRGLATDVSSARDGLYEVEAPAPTTALTESVLRPFQTSPSARVPRPKGGPVRLVVGALLAAGIGFATFRLSVPAPASAPSEAARVPAAAAALEPALPLPDLAPEPVIQVAASAPPAPPPEEPAPLKHRHARGRARGLSGAEPGTAPSSPRTRAIDVDNPYQQP
jgi:serine/threonine-protein kinase